MGLSEEILSMFAKATKDEKPKNNESTVYGKVVEQNGDKYVLLDGSESLTPVDSTVDMAVGERVSVLIKNHTATVTGNITSPASRKVDVDNLSGSVSNLESDNANIFEKLTASEADIKKLKADSATIADVDINYAKIDFANINEEAVKKLFSDSGIIKDLVVSEGRITGELVGVTIKGDLIEGNTVKADKLVILGENGLYYKLNVNALGETTASSDPKYQNGLDGSAIIAKSITATKISVDDLVAFGATIGGFNIGDNSLYSGVKNGINNTTPGIYMSDEGQIYIGDADHYIRFFKSSEDGEWKLNVAANEITFGSSNKTIETAIEEIKEEIPALLSIEDTEVPILLHIESSRGTVFKNDSISTLLSVVIYRGSNRITDMNTLRSLMGPNVYLQWKWQRMNDEEYGIISSSDERIGNEGFTFLLSPEDVDSKITFICELIN